MPTVTDYDSLIKQKETEIFKLKQQTHIEETALKKLQMERDRAIIVSKSEYLKRIDAYLAEISGHTHRTSSTTFVIIPFFTTEKFKDIQCLVRRYVRISWIDGSDKVKIEFSKIWPESVTGNSVAQLKHQIFGNTRHSSIATRTELADAIKKTRGVLSHYSDDTKSSEILKTWIATIFLDAFIDKLHKLHTNAKKFNLK